MSLGVARGLRPRRPVAAQYTRGLRPRRPVAAQYTRSLERTPGAGGRGEAGRPRPVGTEPLIDCTSKHVCMCRRFSRPFPVRRKTGICREERKPALRGSRDDVRLRVSEVCGNGETGRDGNGGALADVSCTRRGGPAPPPSVDVGTGNQTETNHTRTIRPRGLCRPSDEHPLSTCLSNGLSRPLSLVRS
jgi:hypothetical protein